MRQLDGRPAIEDAHRFIFNGIYYGQPEPVHRSAIHDLRRVLDFDPQAAGPGPFGRTRERLVELAREALAKIEGGPA